MSENTDSTKTQPWRDQECPACGSMVSVHNASGRIFPHKAQEAVNATPCEMSFAKVSGPIGKP